MCTIKLIVLNYGKSVAKGASVQPLTFHFRRFNSS